MSSSPSTSSPRASRAIVLALLASVGCALPPGQGFVPSDDDDGVDDDDSAAPDDDDTTPPDDDDTTAPVDDDDTTPPADDDDATPAPTTSLEFLLPADGETLAYDASFVVGADGDEPGLVQWTMGAVDLGATSVNGATHQAALTLETVEYPDGDYTMTAELPDWGLSDSVGFTLLNGDLLVYDFPAVTFSPLSPAPPSVFVTVPTPGVSLQVQTWSDPSVPVGWLWGSLYNADGDWAIGGPDDTIYTVWPSSAEPYAGLVPNHPAAPWPVGQYQFWPWADDGSAGVQLTPRALVKRWFGEPTAGLLAIDFYLVAGSGFTAAGAQGSAAFSDFVDALEAVLLEVGIGLGDVRYFDTADGGFADVTSEGELVELFRQSVPSEDRVLNLFVVDALDLPAGDPIGVASHIPGPALAGGTGQAGVAMIAEPILDGDEWTAAALAGHEIGHYLGLFHTSEIGGGMHDPLPDTPVSCDAAECWETNIMDPYLWGSTALSGDQGWVLRRHPLVQLVDESALPARSWAAAAEAGWSIPAGGLPAFCATGSSP